MRVRVKLSDRQNVYANSVGLNIVEAFFFIRSILHCVYSNCIVSYIGVVLFRLARETACEGGWKEHFQSLLSRERPGILGADSCVASQQPTQ